MRCKRCKHTVGVESNFCPNCGKSVTLSDCYRAEIDEFIEILDKPTDASSVAHISELIQGICDEDKNKKETMEFFDTYLTALISILQKYKKLKKYRVKNMKNTEKRLTETLDKVERAFEIKLEELHEVQVDELFADIQSLNNKITQNGMIDSDFELK